MLTPFVTAIILAYALNPSVNWLIKRPIGRLVMPRSLATILIILLLLLIMLAVFLLVVPILAKEWPILQQKIPSLFDKLRATLVPHLQALGIDLPPFDSASLRKLLSTQLAKRNHEIWNTVLASARTGGMTLFSWLVNMLFIPLVLFYLLRDWSAVIGRVRQILPPRWVPKLSVMIQEIDQLLAQYLRGQLSVMLILVIYYSTALAIAGFDVALPVGLLTGLLIFIPYVGFGIGLTLALIAGILQFNGFYALTVIAAIYGAGYILEGFFLTPSLVGERIGLHPLVVILAFLVFGQLFGFIGILLALPICAILSVVLKHLYCYYLDSDFYNRTP